MSYCGCFEGTQCTDHARMLEEVERGNGHWPHQPTSEQLTFELLNPKEGKKHDQEKPDLSLLPRAFLEEVSKAFMHGEKKYGRYNYLNGLAWTRVIAAASRHLSAFNDGEDIDAESGLSHLSHAGACVAMLITYFEKGLGQDNRYKGESK